MISKFGTLKRQTFIVLQVLVGQGSSCGSTGYFWLKVSHEIYSQTVVSGYELTELVGAWRLLPKVVLLVVGRPQICC